jgi:uncharacterized repeat protein (TIGR03803 family)
VTPQNPAIAARADSGRSWTLPEAKFKILYNFRGYPDGGHPEALANVKGTRYGTTMAGGAHAVYGPYLHGGTVFSITRSGTERVLYSFSNGTNGDVPTAPLADVNGTLYGTTITGGAYGCDGGRCGTVFSITTDGIEKVLHSFGGGGSYGSGADGAFPFAGLINVKGTLYGTTEEGGTHGLGTVFSITPDGTEKVLYSFSYGSDGRSPQAPLTELNGTLYGTTPSGGNLNGGTVFSITTRGVEKVLHRFGPGADGAYPNAGLTDVNGTLYGTTEGGGSHYCGRPYGRCGTVFSITPGGREVLLHSFAGGSDGAYPQAALIDVNGTLYGTTAAGGAWGSARVPGQGTIFSISTSGAENVVHSFAKGSDGAEPLAPLLDVKGTLYGTTSRGGHGRCHGGCGTVFSFLP